MNHINQPDFEDCPCSGKNMSNLAAPWILFTLHCKGGLHGYEIVKSVAYRIERLTGKVNVSGFYRHLNMMEKRGMLTSAWDRSQNGPAKKVYSLTESGRYCLENWLETLDLQMALIGEFLDLARRTLSESPEAVLRPEGEDKQSASGWERGGETRWRP